MAKAIGLEKLILKHGKLVCYFVSNPESDFYQGSTFTEVLTFVKNNPQKVLMRQKKEKLTLVFEKTNSIKQALDKLKVISPELSQPFLQVRSIETEKTD
ncbi:MAG: transcription-repair coupling factor (superfamily II helicase) [Bacteroidia bacterium]